MADYDLIDRLIAAVLAALTLRAGLDLGSFTRLGGDAATAESLGAALELASDRLSRVLYALASIGLLRRVQADLSQRDHPLPREPWEADLLTADSLRRRGRATATAGAPAQSPPSRTAALFTG